MATAAKGRVVEADAGGKVKTFVQLNAIGWLMGARMFSGDFGDVFGGGDHRWIVGVQYIGMGLYALSAVLTITSGIGYFRRHGEVLFMN
jgi:phosphatidylglycerophosphate synthase